MPVQMQLMQETHVNIKDEVTLILKTVVLLDQKFGANYISRILRGTDQFELKDKSHASFETFASLKGKHSESIRNLINYLLGKHLLHVNNVRFGSLGITNKGEEFLDHPCDIIVKAGELKTSKYDKQLLAKLKQLRIDLAKENKQAPFRIYTDYTLSCLVDTKPRDIHELKIIPGLSNYNAHRFGPAILSVIQEILLQKAADARAKFLRRTHSGVHQEVKSLFEAGSSIEEIAEKRSVKPLTIENYLCNLHKVGQLNLKPWIEEKLSPKLLKKGIHYFEKSPDSNLKKAYEEIGMDYESLKLCKLYVSKVITLQDEIKLAS